MNLLNYLKLNLVLIMFFMLPSAFAINMSGVSYVGECRWVKPPMTRDQDMCHYDRSQECRDRAAAVLKKREEDGKLRCASRRKKSVCEKKSTEKVFFPSGECKWSGKDPVSYSKDDFNKAFCIARKTSEHAIELCKSKKSEECLKDNQCAFVAPVCYLKWKETSNLVDCKVNKDEKTCLERKDGYACGWGIEIANIVSPILNLNENKGEGATYKKALFSCLNVKKKLFSESDDSCKSRGEWKVFAKQKCSGYPTSKNNQHKPLVSKLITRGRCDLRPITEPESRGGNNGGIAK